MPAGDVGRCPHADAVRGDGRRAIAALIVGLLTLRPDRALVIRRVRHALRHGRTAVVAHPRDEAAAHEASAALEAAGAEVVRSV